MPVSKVKTASRRISQSSKKTPRRAFLGYAIINIHQRAKTFAAVSILGFGIKLSISIRELKLPDTGLKWTAV